MSGSGTNASWMVKRELQFRVGYYTAEMEQMMTRFRSTPAFPSPQPSPLGRGSS